MAIVLFTFGPPGSQSPSVFAKAENILPTLEPGWMAKLLFGEVLGVLVLGRVAVQVLLEVELSATNATPRRKPRVVITFRIATPGADRVFDSI